MLWRIKFEVNSTNSRQLCRTDRSHFWQDFYDTKFRSEFGVWQQYSPRRLHDSLPSKSLPGLKYKLIIWSQALLFRSLKHKTIFQTLLDILVGKIKLLQASVELAVMAWNNLNLLNQNQSSFNLSRDRYVVFIVWKGSNFWSATF